jgi:hypothetical protein
MFALGAQKPPPAAFPETGSKTSEFHAVKDSKADLHDPKMTDFSRNGKLERGRSWAVCKAPSYGRQGTMRAIHGN